MNAGDFFNKTYDWFISIGRYYDEGRDVGVCRGRKDSPGHPLRTVRTANEGD